MFFKKKRQGIRLERLGNLYITPGAAEILGEKGRDALHFVRRHMSGDWGDLCSEDWDANRLAVEDGSRVFSSYNLGGGYKVWVITEADRSATTVLLPEEY